MLSTCLDVVRTCLACSRSLRCKLVSTTRQQQHTRFFETRAPSPCFSRRQPRMSWFVGQLQGKQGGARGVADEKDGLVRRIAVGASAVCDGAQGLQTLRFSGVHDHNNPPHTHLHLMFRAQTCVGGFSDVKTCTPICHAVRCDLEERRPSRALSVTPAVAWTRRNFGPGCVFAPLVGVWHDFAKPLSLIDMGYA